MAYASVLVHVVFATKNRRTLIPAALQPQLWAYIGGIARSAGFKALAVGGVADHVHALLAIPPAMPLSKAMQFVKGSSSKWSHEQVPDFAWQESYGAFSVGISQAPATIRYIQTQAEHHRRPDFRAEWLDFLQRHGIEEYQGTENAAAGD